MPRYKLRHGDETSEIPYVEQNVDKDPAQLVPLPSLCQFPVLLVHVAEPVQWDHGYDARARDGPGWGSHPYT